MSRLSWVRTCATFAIATLCMVLSLTIGPANANDKEMPGHHMVSANGIDVMLMLDPASPVAKQKVNLTITLRRSNGHAAVAAQDVRIRWSMPSMGHDLEEKRAVPHRTVGTYGSTFRFPVDGRYQALVIVDDDGKPVELAVPIAIGSAGGDGAHGGGKYQKKLPDRGTEQPHEH